MVYKCLIRLSSLFIGLTFNECITIAVTKVKTLELQQNKTLTEEKFLRRAFDQIAHLLKRQKH